MDKKSAEYYTDKVREFETLIQNMLQFSEKFGSEEYHKKATKISGEFLGNLYLDVMIPSVYSEHPDLDLGK